MVSGWAEAWRAAYVAAAAGRWREAAGTYSQLIAAERLGKEVYLGCSLEARLGRGFAHTQAGDYLEAIEDFAFAEALWPGLVEPIILKGKAHYLEGNHAFIDFGPDGLPVPDATGIPIVERFAFGPPDDPSDPANRPVDLVFGPDGAMYVTDIFVASGSRIARQE